AIVPRMHHFDGMDVGVKTGDAPADVPPVAAAQARPCHQAEPERRDKRGNQKDPRPDLHISENSGIAAVAQVEIGPNQELDGFTAARATPVADSFNRRNHRRRRFKSAIVGNTAVSGSRHMCGIVITYIVNSSSMPYP